MIGRHTMRRDVGFTLVELLVVIGVIAVLLGLLIPAIGRARAAAQSVVCQANLRSIGQAMYLYATQNNDAIPGSPHTTGRSLWYDDGTSLQLRTGVTVRHLPGEAIALYDFIGPLARMMSNVVLPDTDDGVPLLRAYRELKVFQCPVNSGVVAKRYGSPVAMEDGPMLSYGTGLAFMLPAYKGAGYSGTASLPSPRNYWSVDAGYIPRLSKVGNPSEKIFCADSGRWSRYDTTPTFSMKVDSDHNDTMFGDFGPFWVITKSYDRSIPNNLNSATVDGRVYGYRHGTRAAGKRDNSYKINVVFFDGHTETLDEMASANPDLWLPRGTVITDTDDPYGGVFPDVRARYLPNTSKANPYVVP